MKDFKKSTIYQIYPKSFNDSNGDGIGDLRGIIAKLDYLKELGIDCIWLTPFYISPQRDNGYDIADYYNVDPLFGTMKDFEELVEEAKKRNIELMLDMVFNHTSTEHKWFKKALNGDEKYKNFYIFKKGKNEEALKYFYTAKDLGRNDDWIYLHLYHNLKTTKGEEEALKYFEEQAKIEDKNPVLLEALGNIYMLEAANYEKAEKTFQKAFALSGDGQQLFNRGRALAALKKYEEAIEVLLESRQLSLDEDDVVDGEDLELAHSYVGIGDKDNAQKYLDLARDSIDKQGTLNDDIKREIEEIEKGILSLKN